MKKSNIIDKINNGIELEHQFNKDERLALVLGYKVELDIKEVVGFFSEPEEWFQNPDKNDFLKKDLERINLVYNTYQKALRLYPNDVNTIYWNNMIKKIEHIIYDMFKLNKV